MSLLLVFDFDHTVIEENSDLHVRKLFPDGRRKSRGGGRRRRLGMLDRPNAADLPAFAPERTFATKIIERT